MASLFYINAGPSLKSATELRKKPCINECLIICLSNAEDEDEDQHVILCCPLSWGLKHNRMSLTVDAIKEKDTAIGIISLTGASTQQVLHISTAGPHLWVQRVQIEEQYFGLV